MGGMTPAETRLLRALLKALQDIAQNLDEINTTLKENKDKR